MTTLEKPAAASFEFTEKLMRRGTDFFHHKIVEDALGVKLPEAPPHPFSEEETTQAIELEQQLIWFPAKDAAGEPITMKRFYESFENQAPLGGKLLFGIGWCKDEPFFAEATARPDKTGLGQWRLVGQQAIPGAKGVNYLEQTIIGARHVRDVVFGDNPPKHLLPILQEPAEREEEITQLMKEDWQKAAEILANLPFNQLFRETPVEALIRVILSQKVNRTRLLESEYSWTNSRSSAGYLVSFGGAVSAGASLDSWDPRNVDDYIGFFLSRSENAESE